MNLKLLTVFIFDNAKTYVEKKNLPESFRKTIVCLAN